MKIIFHYVIGTEIDIPEAELKNAFKKQDGSEFDRLAKKYQPKLRELESWADGELSDVYNPIANYDAPATVNDNYPENIYTNYL